MININQELFALPVGLTTAIVLDGEELFTSDSLKEKFILSMIKTGRAQPIKKHLEMLVEKGFVNPVFMNKNIFKILAFKVFAAREHKMTAGFYYPAKKQVFILLDNNINIFGFAGNDLVASTLIHECIHMASGRNPTKFFSIFKSDFEAFYGSVFSDIFKLEDKKAVKEIQTITKFIYDSFERKAMKMTKYNEFLINYHKQLQTLSKYSTMKDQEFMKTLQDFIVVMKLYFLNIKTFLSSIRKFRHIIAPMYKAYQEVYKEKNNVTMCIQELFIPSEIACVASEIKPSGKHTKAYGFMS